MRLSITLMVNNRDKYDSVAFNALQRVNKQIAYENAAYENDIREEIVEIVEIEEIYKGSERQRE